MERKKEETPQAGYILVWLINTYHEMGGGLDWCIVEDEEYGLEIINNLNKQWKEKFELMHFSRYSNIVEIEPVKIVTKFKIK